MSHYWSLLKKYITLVFSSLLTFSSIRVRAKILFTWVVGYVSRSPRFKRLVLRVLNRMPALAIRLRQMHLGAQLGANWTKSTIQVWRGISAHGDGSRSIGQPRDLMTDGINARQRSPLEAHFHTYVGRE